jgi:4-hydroxybenzoate polyprenyltransferase
MEKYGDFTEFIRLKVCLFVAAIAVSGFMLFNAFNSLLLPVVFSGFLITAGAYSLNNLVDSKEDSINRGKHNYFVENKRLGFSVSLALLLSGIASSFFLSIQAIAFVFLALIVILSYNFLKLKRFLLIKNLFTGFGVGLLFLVGALASPQAFTAPTIYYYFLFSFLVFIASIVSDLRDVKGDALSGIKTLAFFLGTQKTKRIVFILMIAFISCIVFLQARQLLPFLLFMVPAAFLLSRNSFTKTHSLLGFSLIAQMLWVLVL